MEYDSGERHRYSNEQMQLKFGLVDIWPGLTVEHSLRGRGTVRRGNLIDTDWKGSSNITNGSTFSRHVGKRASMYVGLLPEHFETMPARKPQKQDKTVKHSGIGFEAAANPTMTPHHAVRLQSFVPPLGQGSGASQANHRNAEQELTELTSLMSADELHATDRSMHTVAESPHSANFGPTRGQALGSPQAEQGRVEQDWMELTSIREAAEPHATGNGVHTSAKKPNTFILPPVHAGLFKVHKTKADVDAEINEIALMASQKLRLMASQEANASELRAAGNNLHGAPNGAGSSHSIYVPHRLPDRSPDRTGLASSLMNETTELLPPIIRKLCTKIGSRNTLYKSLGIS